MRVTVFGGSAPRPGEPAYEEAVQLGRWLGEAGYTVLTGGYLGTMEAVSRGAAETGGHVIGVTCSEIEHWRKVGANHWVQEEWRCKTLMDRLRGLLENCDAALALPGGPGTLVEISLLWNHMIISALPRRPVILIGEGWKKVFDSFYTAQNEYISLRDRELISFASNIDEAFSKLNHSNL